MSNHRRNWSLSEKLEAVQLMKQLGVGKTSRQLEISSTTLYKWERHFDKYGEQGLMPKAISDKNPELERIKKENHELKMLVAEKELIIRVQNELLKKSP
jgi:transposase-like protein